jgi:hypothetical protein
MKQPTSNPSFPIRVGVLLGGTLLACLLLLDGGTAPAQPPATKISQGVSRQTAVRLEKAARANAQEAEAAAARNRVAIASGLSSDLKQERAAFQAHLDRQPAVAAFKKECEAIRKSGKGKKQSAREIQNRIVAWDKLYAKHRPMLEAALKAARIDDARVAGVVGKRFPGLSLVKRPLHTFSSRAATQIQTDSSRDPLSMKPPYTTSNSFERSADVALTNKATANKKTGQVTLTAEALVAGGGNNLALVGGFLKIPPKLGKLLVTVRVHESHRLSAGAAVGGAQSSLDLVVELTGPDDKTHRKVKNITTVVAPLIALVRDDGESDQVVSATFAIPKSGGEFLLQAGARSDLEAVGLGGTGAVATVEVNAIEVAAVR